MNDMNPITSLTPSEVCHLIDLAIAKRRKNLTKDERYGEYHLFRQILGESDETDMRFSRFLRDVTTCPQAVLREAQAIINEKAP